MNPGGFCTGVAIIAEKNIRIYYNKPPVFIFGLLFPVFLFLAFYIGRDIDIPVFLPGFMGMTLFFSSSSVGPLITSWEKRDRTFERLLSFPTTLEIILLGDIAAGLLFGLIITALVMIGILLVLPISVIAPGIWVAGTVLGVITFAALGTLLASPASENPSNIMMLSSLVRFPLIFISGIFVPLSALEGPALYLALLSPLTYLVDLYSFGIHGGSALSPLVDGAVLVLWTVVFFLLSRAIQHRNLTRGM